MWAFRTSVGIFSVGNNGDDEYELALDGVWIGTYQDPQEAAQALAAGVVFHPPGVSIDYEALDIPEYLGDWEYWS